MTTGLIGRKIGMMRLYDGGGHVRGVTAIEVGPNFVTQLRTPERDGYSAVQLGFAGNRKRTNRPERGHLRAAGLSNDTILTRLQEFRADDGEELTLGQELGAGQFEPGTFVDVRGTSRGRGFAGGVRRWNFAGGPKTHGQSDRHRAPGSIGSGTTPGRVFKGLKMAGHMGAETVAVLNLLVVAVDAARNLVFLEGSVPGAKGGIVSIERGRRKPLADYVAPQISASGVEAAEVEPVEALDAPAVDEELESAVAEAEAAEEAAADSEAAAETDQPAADATDTADQAKEDEGQS